jgi:hypothetical protein
MATWSANWSFFNAIITEVAHNDFTFTRTFSGHTFDVIVEDHFSGFHQSTSVVTSSGGIAFFEAWKIEAFSRVSGTTFTSFSGDFVGLSWWADWWMVNAKRFVALAFELSAATFVVVVVTDVFDLDEFLTFSGASWDDKFSAFGFEVWNEGGTRFWFWAFISSTASIIRSMDNFGFTVFTSWFFFMNTSISNVITSDFSVFSTTTWLANIVFIMEQIAFVILNTFVFASVTSRARITNTSAFVNTFTQFTTFTVTQWSNSGWTSVANTLVFQTAIKSFSFVSDRV